MVGLPVPLILPLRQKNGATAALLNAVIGALKNRRLFLFSSAHQVQYTILSISISSVTSLSMCLQCALLLLLPFVFALFARAVLDCLHLLDMLELLLPLLLSMRQVLLFFLLPL
jgi:hypothetical protein